jgi:hypothetical protein
MIEIRRSWRYRAIFLACVLAAWRSGSAQTLRSHVGTSVARSGSDSKIGKTTLYVGLFNGQAVNIYDAFGNGQPTTQLLDGLYNSTGGIAVGRDRKVYVSTSGGLVVVFPGGGFVPLQRYRFPDQFAPAFPTGIAVDSVGTLYAPLYFDGLVAVYPKGDTQKASLTIPVPSGNAAFAAAVDDQNNVYIEYGLNQHLSPGYIEKCPPNSTQCTNLGITLGAPGSNLVVDSQGNLIACDQLAAQIDVFAPGSTKPRVISQGLVGCGSFALNKAQNTLFVANQAEGGGPAVISVFDYASGNLVNTISGGIPSGDLIFGVALSPSLQ